MISFSDNNNNSDDDNKDWDSQAPMTEEEQIESKNSEMLHVRNRIIKYPNSYYTTRFFINVTLKNKQILEKYPDLEKFRPKRRTGPECAWCKRGSKHKSVYTSHWMFGKKNEIICPKLLKERCRNCGKMGHVMGDHCPEQQKERCYLLPATSKRRHNYREDSDYREGDSDDYIKFPLSTDSENDSDEEQIQIQIVPEQPWKKNWQNYYDDIVTKANTVTKAIIESGKPEVPKKTWASVVSSNKK